MKLKEWFRQAIVKQDTRLIGSLLAHCRFRHGMTAQETEDMALRCVPECTADDWRNLVNEAT